MWRWRQMFRCSHWARELSCINGRVIYETCGRKDPLEIFCDPGNCREAWALQWFIDFMFEFAKAIQERPGIRLGSDEWAEQAVRIVRPSCVAQDSKPATIGGIFQLVAMDADLQRARDQVRCRPSARNEG